MICKSKNLFITSCARGNDSSSEIWLFRWKRKSVCWTVVLKQLTFCCQRHTNTNQILTVSVLFKASTLFKPLSVRVLCSSLKSFSYQHVRCLKCASELSYKQNSLLHSLQVRTNLRVSCYLVLRPSAPNVCPVCWKEVCAVFNNHSTKQKSLSVV